MLTMRRDKETPMGYSTVGGQTLSPFRREGVAEEDQPVIHPSVRGFKSTDEWQTAGGSSSGSAVSIAAGLVPLALGTETGGSNVYPASASAVHAMTLPKGEVSTDGVFRISDSFDRIGLMAGCTRDLDLLREVLTGKKGHHCGGHENEGRTEKFKVGVADIIYGLYGDNGAEAKWDTKVSSEIAATS